MKLSGKIIVGVFVTLGVLMLLADITGNIATGYGLMNEVFMLLHIDKLWKAVLFYLAVLVIFALYIFFGSDYFYDVAEKKDKKVYTPIKSGLLIVLPFAYYVGCAIERNLLVPNLLTPEIMNYGTLCLCGVVLLWNLIQFGLFKGIPLTLFHVIIAIIGGDLCRHYGAWMVGIVVIGILVLHTGGGPVDVNTGDSETETGEKSPDSEPYHWAEHPTTVMAMDNYETFHVSRGAYGSLQIYRFEKWNTLYKNIDGTYSDGNGLTYKGIGLY